MASKQSREAAVLNCGTPADQESRSMRMIQLMIGLLLASTVVMWLTAGSVLAAGESYALGYDVIGHAERVLMQAAANSPDGHNRIDLVQRDVYDITFLLEQAWRTAEKANDVASRDYANQALTLLRRAVARGHFDPAQVEPIFTLIRQLLPNVPV